IDAPAGDGPMKALERSDGGLSTRAQYGLVALGALLSIMIFDYASELKLRTKSERDELQRQTIARASIIGTGNAWIERSETAKDALASRRGRLWTGVAAGVIAADVAEALERAASDAGAQRTRIEVDPEIVTIAGLSTVRFQLRISSASGEIAAKLIASLGAAEQIILLDEMELSQNLDGGAYMNLGGVAPVLLLSAPLEGSPNGDEPDA
ncbi:MAG: hypothetical protein AAF850_13305, partial [Pseudomonadota bacterium]